MSKSNETKPTNQSTGEGNMKKQPHIKLVHVDPNAKPTPREDKHLPQGERLLRWRDVGPRVGICRSYAHVLVREGKFPEPVKVIGRRARAWVESEINAWVNEQIANRKKAK